jgi:flagellar basal body L-ring protein FlgH
MKNVILSLLSVLSLCSFYGCSGMIDSLLAESAAVDAQEKNLDRDRGDSDATYQPSYNRPARRASGPSANSMPSYGMQNRGFGRRLASLEENPGDEDAPLAGPRGHSEDFAASAPAQAADYRRATRQDFIDSNASENSLWDGQGQTNYLFSQNRRREAGDLITADVEKELKREIQYQLWLTLPIEQRRVPKRGIASTDPNAPAAPGAAAPAAAPATPAAAAKSALDANKDAAAEAAKTNMASTDKDEDIVRMEVAENMGNGLMRVVGQKRVIYRGLARLVEVTGLINSKDIDDSNHAKSSAFLDMKTQVIQ